MVERAIIAETSTPGGSKDTPKLRYLQHAAGTFHRPAWGACGGVMIFTTVLLQIAKFYVAL